MLRHKYFSKYTIIHKMKFHIKYYTIFCCVGASKNDVRIVYALRRQTGICDKTVYVYAK